MYTMIEIKQHTDEDDQWNLFQQMSVWPIKQRQQTIEKNNKKNQD